MPATAEQMQQREPLADPFWPPGLTFECVLQQARARDREALGMIYRRFLPVVYRFLLSRVADVPVAEDLTSETFFAVMAGIDEVRAQDELGFATWVLGIARNKLSQHFRHLKQRREVPMMLAEGSDGAEPPASAEADDPLAVITARERWAEVIAALDHLTAEQRTVLLQRGILGRSSEEVARMMGKPANAIYGLQFRALAALTRHLALNEPAERAAQGTRGRQREGERRTGHAARGEA